VSRTGDIGLFKILSEGGISAGVRRIEAITGDAAVAFVQAQEQRLRELSSLLGGGDQVIAKVQQLLDRVKQGERELNQLKSKAASASIDELASSALDIDGIKVLGVRLEGIDAKVLRQMLDTLKQKLVNAVIVLASVADGKATLIAGVCGSALDRTRAGDVLGFVAGKAGGKGGGRPDMAQGGGNDGPGLREALADIQKFVLGQTA
jgi:alanyl-tRNA synthetase